MPPWQFDMGCVALTESVFGHDEQQWTHFPVSRMDIEYFLEFIVPATIRQRLLKKLSKNLFGKYLLQIMCAFPIPADMSARSPSQKFSQSLNNLRYSASSSGRIYRFVYSTQHNVGGSFSIASGA